MTVEYRPVVLFLCIHNSGRSAAARVLLDHYAQGRVEVLSAGSEPGAQINPAVAQILTERGLDPTKEFPKPLTDEIAPRRRRDRDHGLWRSFSSGAALRSADVGV